MGWKANSVFVRPAAMPDDPRRFLEKLGFAGLSPLGERSYGEICGLRTKAVWIGLTGECLILSGRALAQPFLEPEPSQLTRRLFELFPSAEIGAVGLESAVNGWGFAVFRAGKPVRRKWGDSEAGTSVDEGEPLAEEIELLARSALVEDGRRVYRLPELPGEELEEAEVGESFVSEIYRRFTSMRLLTDEALRRVRMQGFAPPPWWKFWVR